MSNSAIVCALCGGRSHEQLFDYPGSTGRLKKSYTVLKCDGCRLIFVHPAPAEDELREFYDRQEYFSGYQDNARWKAWNVKHHFLRKLELIERFVPKGRLLDVGTGDGLFPHVAAARGWDAYGLEISSHSLGYARGAYGDVKLVQGKLGDGCLEGVVFDAITFVHNLEHYPDPGVPLREAHGMLRQGGVILVAAPNLDPKVERFLRTLPVGRRGHTRLMRMVGSIYPPDHLVSFSTATLSAFLERSGFARLHLTYSSKVRPLFMVGWGEWLAQEALRLPLTLLRSGMHVEMLARKI